MSATYLSKQRVAELKFAFNQCDKNKNGLLDSKEVTYLLKSIGVYLSKNDKKALEQENADRGEFTFEDFLTVGEVVYNDVAIAKAIQDGLKEFSDTNGFIQKDKLREVLRKMGLAVRLTPREVELFLSVELDAKNLKQLSFSKIIHRILRE